MTLPSWQRLDILGHTPLLSYCPIWEPKSDEKGLFIVVEKTVAGKDMRVQLMNKIGK